MLNFKFLFIVLMLCTASTVSSQRNYGDFEWEIVNIGIAIPSGSNLAGGISIHSEPRYNLRDDMSIGLRYQTAVMLANVTGDDIELSVAFGLSLFGDYYLTTTSVMRPFIGVGLGFFGGGIFTEEDDYPPFATSLGFTPRMGYDFGALRITVEYNKTFSDGIPTYFGLNLGITLGGGFRG